MTVSHMKVGEDRRTVGRIKQDRVGWNADVIVQHPSLSFRAVILKLPCRCESLLVTKYFRGNFQVKT
jgi:hypothetical protein